MAALEVCATKRLSNKVIQRKNTSAAVRDARQSFLAVGWGQGRPSTLTATTAAAAAARLVAASHTASATQCPGLGKSQRDLHRIARSSPSTCPFSLCTRGNPVAACVLVLASCASSAWSSCFPSRRKAAWPPCPPARLSVAFVPCPHFLQHSYRAVRTRHHARCTPHTEHTQHMQHATQHALHHHFHHIHAATALHPARTP